MKSKIKFIFLAIILAVLSRYLYYSIIGLIITYLDELEWLSKIICSVPKEYMVTVYHINDLFNTALSLFIVMFVPMLLLGFITGGSILFCTAVVFFTSILFDIFYYYLSMNDLALLAETLTPAWVGISKLLILLIIIWGMQLAGVRWGRGKMGTYFRL